MNGKRFLKPSLVFLKWNLCFLLVFSFLPHSLLLANGRDAGWLESAVYIVDNATPMVQFNPNGNANSQQNHRTTVTASDELSGVQNSEYQWTMDVGFPAGDSWTSFSHGDELLLPSGQNGSFYLQVKAVDQAGIETKASSQRIEVQTIAGLFAGGQGTEDDPYLIGTAQQLHSIRENLDAHYRLIADVDLSVYSSNGGWQPIGTLDSYFMGTLDGQGHVISGLMINRDEFYQALFGIVGRGGKIRNVGLEDATINVVGDMISTLVAWNFGEIRNSYATGSITARNYTGGLVAFNQGTITDSYTSVNIQGELVAGGLAAHNNREIHQSYSSGTTQAHSIAGGLVGENGVGSRIQQSYTTGEAHGTSPYGGLVGKNEGTVSQSFWNESVYSDSAPNNGIGTAVTGEQMQLRHTFAGWDFVNTWHLYNGQTQPFLQWSDPILDLNAQIDLPLLETGDTAQITVSTQHQSGSSYEATSSAIYTVTEGNAVVEVDDSGRVTAKTPGAAKITVAVGGEQRTIDVSVRAYNITAVDSLSPIVVEYGTSLAKVGLPETVSVTLNHGATVEVSVTWDGGTPAYNGEQADTYKFNGTLALPPGVGNPQGLTAEIEVAVGESYVTGVDALSPMHVEYGTSLAKVGLPETVSVTLNHGAPVEVAVTWDGGTPAYNGEQSGAYTFNGTLVLPPGVGNPQGLTAEIEVTVGESYVTGVAALSPMHVEYGTPITEVGLPDKVSVTLNHGAPVEVAVTWDGGTPVYNGEQTGTYTFNGTLTLPPGVGNPQGLTAEIEVTVSESYVTGVAALPPVTVEYGTPVEEVGLPETVSVTLNHGATVEVAVTWDGGTPTYNGEQTGTYTFNGTLTLPPGVGNPQGLTAEIEVTVGEPYVTGVATLLPVTVEYGTPVEEVGLPETVSVTLNHGATVEVAVTWDGGTPAYNGEQSGTYKFNGTLALPPGIGNPQGLNAEIEVTVGESYVTGVAALPPVTVEYGTPVEEVGLPETVSVTLNHGAPVEVAVTWDGGTPAYNGEQAGTYKFNGALALPPGVGNPQGLTAEIEVTVGEPYVTGVAALSPMHVEYGTPVEEVGLPETVSVTLNHGAPIEVGVTWDGGTPTYNGEQSGAYTFNGTLVLPPGVGNPQGLTAEIEVTVGELYVTGVAALPPVTVEYGTSQAEVGLPDTVSVTLNHGAPVEVGVTWDGGTPTYTGEQAGTYKFNGVLALPPGVGNPQGLTAEIEVTVGESYATGVAALSPMHVEYGTSQAEVGLPDTVSVTLNHGEPVEVGVTWDGGTPAYNGEQSGTYKFNGALALPLGVGNPQGLTAEIEVKVEEPYVTGVAALSPMHVEYGTSLAEVGLPDTVSVTLNHGATVEVAVTWDGGTPAYNGEQSGTYKFNGTLALPPGIGNPDNLKAQLQVLVADKKDEEPGGGNGSEGEGGGSDPGGGSPGGGGNGPGTPIAGEQPEDSSYFVGVSGRTIIFAGGQLVIPNGANSQSFNVTIEELNNWQALPGFEQRVSKAFSITMNPHRMLQEKALVQLDFNTKLSGREQEVSLFRFDADIGGWIELTDILVDWEKLTVSGTTDIFGTFVVKTMENDPEDEKAQVNPEPGTGDHEEQPHPQPHPEVELTDLQGHWAEESIRHWVRLGVIQGLPDQTFRPDQDISRAEFVTLLVRALGLDMQSGSGANTHVFADTENHWAQAAIATAYQHGIVEGYSETMFGIHDPITREQMAVMMMRIMEERFNAEPAAFADQASISAWAAEAVAVLAGQGILNGYPDNSFQPQKEATRAEAAVILSRLLQ